MPLNLPIDGNSPRCKKCNMPSSIDDLDLSSSVKLFIVGDRFFRDRLSKLSERENITTTQQYISLLEAEIELMREVQIGPIVLPKDDNHLTKVNVDLDQDQERYRTRDVLGFAFLIVVLIYFIAG